MEIPPISFESVTFLMEQSPDGTVWELRLLDRTLIGTALTQEQIPKVVIDYCKATYCKELRRSVTLYKKELSFLW